MTEQTPNQTEDRDQLLRDVYGKLQPVLTKFCTDMGPLLTAADGAIVIVGLSAAILAASAGPDIAAAMLRGLADQLAAPLGASLN